MQPYRPYQPCEPYQPCQPCEPCEPCAPYRPSESYKIGFHTDLLQYPYHDYDPYLYSATELGEWGFATATVMKDTHGFFHLVHVEETPLGHLSKHVVGVTMSYLIQQAKDTPFTREL